MNDGRDVLVICSKTHPNFDPDDSRKYDIAVLKLAIEVTGVPFVKLNNNTSVPTAGSTVTVIGMGDTTSNGQDASQLRKLNYSSISDSACKAYWGNEINTGVSVCAQNTRSAGACFGVS